jgi:hypothetical protein
MSILKEIEFRVFNKKNIVKPKPISQTYEMVFLRIFFRNLLKSFERSASKSKYISDSQTLFWENAIFRRSRKKFAEQF